MWRDTMTLSVLGACVDVERWIESPATPEELRVVFPDGSRLSVRVEAPVREEVSSEADAGERARGSVAYGIYALVLGAVRSCSRDVCYDVDGLEVLDV